MKKYLVLLFILTLTSACSSKKYDTVNTEEEAAVVSSVKETNVIETEIVKIPDRVFFAFDKSNIDNEARKVLDLTAEWLKENRDVKLLIEGHADERGTKEYNIALGHRRASSVKTYLVSKGISASRIKTISYGKEKPEVIGKGEAVWAKNRRAVTVILENK